MHAFILQGPSLNLATQQHVEQDVPYVYFAYISRSEIISFF